MPKRSTAFTAAMPRRRGPERVVDGRELACVVGALGGSEELGRLFVGDDASRFFVEWLCGAGGASGRVEDLGWRAVKEAGCVAPARLPGLLPLGRPVGGDAQGADLLRGVIMLFVGFCFMNVRTAG